MLFRSLVEATSDTNLQAAVAGTSQQASSLGITAVFNHSGNDGTITRFGWKAQNKSLIIFAGEAYNVEQGVTNEAFPMERTNPGDGPLPAAGEGDGAGGVPHPGGARCGDILEHAFAAAE